MKTIGIIDYYVSEWHAYKYHSILEDCARAVGEEFKIAYAYGELDVSLYDGLTTAEWCEKHGAVKCDSIEEVCKKSDYIMILAPSNPETHLRLAAEALKYGKNTFIDKTFAPDYATAKEIYDIADSYGTKIFSSSALRYATELDGMKAEKSIAITGGGGNFPEYVIHQAEMLIKILGCDVSGVHSEARSDGIFAIDVKFDSGKSGAMLFDPKSSYAISAMLPSGTSVEKRIDSKLIFLSLIKDILRFFNDGTVSFNLNETLSVIKLRELAIKSVKNL